MDVSDLKGLFGEIKKRMDAQIEHVRRELAGVRTGRASVNILDSVHVEAYGAHMPINQVASLSIPEPSLIVAQPFDPSLMGAIEKGWSRFACRYVYSATSVRRRRSDRITGAGVTEVQDDGRFPKSGETGPRSAVRSGTAALFAAQVP